MKRREIKISRFNYAKLLTAQLQHFENKKRLLTEKKQLNWVKVFAIRVGRENFNLQWEKLEKYYLVNESVCTIFFPLFAVWIIISKVQVLNSFLCENENAKFRIALIFEALSRELSENSVECVLHKTKKLDFVQIFELTASIKNVLTNFARTSVSRIVFKRKAYELLLLPRASRNHEILISLVIFHELAAKMLLVGWKCKRAMTS